MDHYYSKVLITNAKLSRLTDANPSTISSILKEARELGLVTPDNVPTQETVDFAIMATKNLVTETDFFHYTQEFAMRVSIAKGRQAL